MMRLEIKLRKSGCRSLVSRKRAATQAVPQDRLAAEQAAFGPLPEVAADYGFFESVVVSREGLVTIETNRYSVPVAYVGQVLTVRIHEQRLELFCGRERVAVHPRHSGRSQHIVDPAHFEEMFPFKPRARVMVYRDWLVGLAPHSARYISEICRRRRDEMSPQILALYTLAHQVETADFLAAVELATEQHSYGAEYLEALLARASRPPVEEPVSALRPLRQVVERDLEHYERYVANRDWLLAKGGSQ
jgi:hypothetical protein